MADRQIIATASLIDQNVVATLEKYQAELNKLSAELQAQNAIQERVVAVYGETSAAAIKLQGSIDTLTAKQTALNQIVGAGAPILEANAAATEQLAAANTALAGSTNASTAAEELNNVATAENAVAKEANNWMSLLPRMQAGTNGLNASLATLDPALIGLGLTLAATAGLLIKASEAAIQWQTQLTQMQNNSGATDAEMQQLSSTIIQGSVQSGESLKDLAQGMRQIKDYQFDATDATKIQDAAMKAAASTGADYNTVAGVLAGALHQYGLSGNDAARVMNTLTEAQIRGNMTMEQFSQNTSRAISTASNLGVPLEQVAAAEATLTRQFGNAAQAQTQVVNIMTRIVHPTQQAREEIARLAQVTPELTHAFSAQGLSEYGLTGINNMLVQTYEKMGLTQAQAIEQTLNLMNAQRGGLGESVLLEKGFADYNNILAQTSATMSGQLTPVQDNWNRTAHTTQNEMDRMKAAFGVGLQAVGAFALGMTGAKKAMDDLFGIVDSSSQKASDAATKTAASVQTATQAMVQDVGNLGSAYSHQSEQFAQWGNDAKDTLTNVQQYLDDNAKAFDSWSKKAMGSQEAERESANQMRSDLQDQLDQINKAIEDEDTIIANSSGDVKTAAETQKQAFIDARNTIVVKLGEIDAAQRAVADNAVIAANKIYQAWNSQPGFAPGGQNYMGGAQGGSPYVLPSPVGQGGYYNYDFSPNGSGTPGTPSSHTVDINPSHAKSAANKADKANDAGRQAENEMNLVRAKQAVEAIQDKINDTQDKYNRLIQQENDIIDELKDKEAAALAPIQAGLMQAEAYQKAEAKKAEDEIHGLDVQIHTLQGSLKSLETVSANALKPFQQEIDDAEGALADFKAEVAAMDQQFANTAHALQDQMYALEQAEKAALRPYDAEIRTTSDALWGENQALQALKDAADDQAYVMEQKILPLQNELNRMKREDQALSHAQTLHDEAVKTENLAAQLANLTPGTQAYLRVQQELAQQQTQTNRMSREFSLEDKIAALNEEKNIEQQAADARMHAIQMEMRANQERLAILQHERELVQRNFEDQKAILQEQIAANDHARSDYDFLAAARERDLQDAVTKAKAKYAIEFSLYANIKNDIQGNIDKLTDLRNTKQWEFQESDRINKGIVDGYKSTYDAMKGYYDAEIKLHQDNVTELGKSEKADLAPLQDALKQAQSTYQDLSNAYQIIEKIDSASDKGAKNIPGAADALVKARDAINAIVPKLPPLTSGINDMNTALTETNTKVTTATQQTFDGSKDGSLSNLYKKAFDKTDTTSGNSILGTWNDGFDKMFQHMDSAWGPQTKDRLEFWLQAMDNAVHAKVDDMVNYWNSKIDQMKTPPGGTDPSNPPSDIPKYASGGIVTKPTVALVGEDGPEAIIPLRNQNSSAAYIPMSGGGGGVVYWSGNVVIPVQQLPDNLSAWRRVARTAGIAIQEEFNRHSGTGAPFGKG